MWLSPVATTPWGPPARGAPRLPPPATPSRNALPWLALATALACVLALASKEPFVVIAPSPRSVVLEDGAPDASDDASARARPPRSSRCSGCSRSAARSASRSASSQMGAPLADTAHYGSLPHYAALGATTSARRPPSPPTPAQSRGRRGVGVVARRPSRSRFRARVARGRRRAVVEGRALPASGWFGVAFAPHDALAPRHRHLGNRYGYFPLMGAAVAAAALATRPHVIACVISARPFAASLVLLAHEGVTRHRRQRSGATTSRSARRGGAQAGRRAGALPPWPSRSSGGGAARQRSTSSRAAAFDPRYARRSATTPAACSSSDVTAELWLRRRARSRSTLDRRPPPQPRRAALSALLAETAGARAKVELSASTPPPRRLRALDDPRARLRPARAVAVSDARRPCEGAGLLVFAAALLRHAASLAATSSPTEARGCAAPARRRGLATYCGARATCTADLRPRRRAVPRAGRAPPRSSWPPRRRWPAARRSPGGRRRARRPTAAARLALAGPFRGGRATVALGAWPATASRPRRGSRSSYDPRATTAARRREPARRSCCSNPHPELRALPDPRGATGLQSDGVLRGGDGGPSGGWRNAGDDA